MHATHVDDHNHNHDDNHDDNAAATRTHYDHDDDAMRGEHRKRIVPADVRNGRLSIEHIQRHARTHDDDDSTGATTQHRPRHAVRRHERERVTHATT